MRLVDADKLLQETWKVETKDMFHMTKMIDVVSAIDIKEAPTVNAIPIEWLIDYIIKEGPNVPLENVLYDWEKENEID